MDGFDEMLKLGWTLEDIKQKVTELEKEAAMPSRLKYWGHHNSKEISLRDYAILVVKKTSEGEIELYDELSPGRNEIVSKEEAKKLFQEAINWIDVL